LIRLNIVLKRLRENKIKSILDVGCGSCSPMRKLLKEGFKVTGFDFSKEMVEEGKKVL
jgi:2-polyprenyl-3-methyl-5-hydroxy-6-metoxy-1,4-benzoquinol methylase